MNRPVPCLALRGFGITDPKVGGAADRLGLTSAAVPTLTAQTVTPAHARSTATREATATQPRTAPAVSPNAIFRCTRRKKTTTGIAVSVDAAMSPPQSMFVLVP